MRSTPPGVNVENLNERPDTARFTLRQSTRADRHVESPDSRVSLHRDIVVFHDQSGFRSRNMYHPVRQKRATKWPKSEYAEPLRCTKKSFRLRGESLEEDAAVTAGLNRLGQAFEKLDEFAKAEPHSRRSLAIYDAQGGKPNRGRRGAEQPGSNTPSHWPIFGCRATSSSAASRSTETSGKYIASLRL